MPAGVVASRGGLSSLPVEIETSPRCRLVNPGINRRRTQPEIVGEYAIEFLGRRRERFPSN